MYKATGINIAVHDLNQNPIDDDILLTPITGKGQLARCRIDIPIVDAVEFIKELQNHMQTYHRNGYWRCGECEGKRVQIKTWIRPGTGAVVDGGDWENQSNDTWCEDCEDHTRLEWVEIHQIPNRSDV